MYLERMSRRAVLSAAGATAAAGLTAAALPGESAAAQSADPVQQNLSNFADLRFGMFNHFNLGTFTDEEWARPDQSPTLFAPPVVDCEQWADAALAAKMSYGVLTTKHHDGFCLWPSEFTGQTVANSGYRQDIVAQYVDAFRSRGLKVGLYFSIWDRTHGVQAYDTRHGVPTGEVIEPSDITYVLAQIRELLTNYGKIDMFITDGYAWQMGQQALPYQQVRNLVKSLQPDAIMVDHGGLSQPWLGDAIYFEQPLGVTAPPGNSYVGLQGQTISNGWFWHPSTPTTDPLKRNAILDHLADLEPKWTSLILNCPPNRAGRLDQNIVARLAEVGAAWEIQPRTGLPAQPRRVEWPVTPVAAYASGYSSGEGPMRALDGKSNTNLETCWSTWRLPLPQAITIDLGGVWSNISTCEYLPKQWGRSYLTDGDITSYAISTSVDGVTFTEATAGTWAPNMTTKVAEWTPRDAGFVRLQARAGTDDYANVSGLSVGGRLAQPTLVSRLPLTTGTYRIEARHSGKVAEVVGAGTANGTNIAQATWRGTTNQQWTFDATGDGFFKIRSLAGGKVMEVAALSRVNGGNVALWADDNLFQQHWAITPTPNGHYLVTNRLSGLSLNVAEASTSDGANIVQWLYSSAGNEQWLIAAEGIAATGD